MLDHGCYYHGHIFDCRVNVHSRMYCTWSAGAVRPRIDYVQRAGSLFAVLKRWNAFDVAFAFVSLPICLCADDLYFGFSVATSVVGQPFAATVVPQSTPTLEQLLPLTWMNDA